MIRRDLGRVLSSVVAVVAVALLASCSGDDDPCSGVSGTCVALRTTMKEADIAARLAQAPANGTLAFGPGTFYFTNSLNLATVPGLTVRGAGMDRTILEFKYQQGGADGLVQNGDLSKSGAITFRDFTVQNTYGNGVKVVGANGVVIQRVKARWTGAIRGPYGLYPVSCKKVLIENSVVDGARDAGFYVGQSDMIVVRNNEALHNVAGIEIENSFNADVHDNDVHDNTGGILVFDLPGLAQVGGHNVRVYANKIHDNNGQNFAAGGTVALVPPGTGGFVMANHDVEVFGNTFTNNKTGGFAIVSYYVVAPSWSDPNYTQPLPAKISVHDNTFSGNGAAPDTTTQLGQLLASGGAAWPGGRVSDVIYDGITGGNPNSAVGICAQKNGGASFVNLHFDQLEAAGFDLTKTMTFDAAPYDCALPALPAVSL